jgi:hypothetical protein
VIEKTENSKMIIRTKDLRDMRTDSRTIITRKTITKSLTEEMTSNTEDNKISITNHFHTINLPLKIIMEVY